MLNATELFYVVDGNDFDYGHDIRAMLKLFSVREELIDKQAGPQYFRDRTTHMLSEGQLDLETTMIYPVIALVAAYSTRDLEDIRPETDVDTESVREHFGLTTRYGPTITIGGDEQADNDGG